MRHLLALIAATAMCWPQALAKDLAFPGIVGGDDRQTVREVAPPWNAVGRIQAAGYTRLESCTGTLIGPRLVMTAAHCLYDPWSGKPLPVKRLNFLAGLHREAHLAAAKVACIKPLAYVPAKAITIDSFRADAALLVLDRTIDSAPIALASDDALAPGATVSHGGYGRDRRYIVSVHAGCKVLSRDGDLAITDCDTNFGQSGGPVFVEVNGQTELAAVMSGFSEHKASIAVSVEAWRSLMQSPDCPVSPAP